MPGKTTPAADALTRQRLLDAAGEVFAAQGFRGATVRAICARARANIAAVNYHFGGKEKLYAAVLEEGAKAALARHPPDGGLPAGAAPEARLRAFCASLLHRVLGDGAPSWHGRLMAREMAEPTAALDRLVETVIRPQSELLGGILRELMPGASAQEVWQMTGSVIAQCLFPKHAEAVLRRLRPDWKPDAGELADALAARTLAAIRGRAGAAPAPAPAAPEAPARRAALERLLGPARPRGGRP